MEQVLQLQLIDTVDAIYLDALRKSDADMIYESLPKIMDHLMKNYGQFTLEDMHDKEQDIIAMYYNQTTSLDTVFSIVDKVLRLV